MSEWKAKRFWTAAQAVAVEGGHTVHLDDRPVRTPAKAALVLPSLALAQAIADEWQSQEKTVDPLSMPMTRAANAAIDKVSVQMAEVIGLLAAYGDSDNICYRAANPPELLDRQTTAWDPLLDWAAERYRAHLLPVEGVMHIAQPPQALQSLATPLHQMTPFELTAMHDLVSLSGSLIIGLAVSDSAFPVDELWISSRIDEDWQIEQWGEDDEASAQAATKRLAFADAARFLSLARKGS